MSAEYDDDEIPLVRSFLNRQQPTTRRSEPMTDEPTVRAYMITNGRTTTTADLSFESMVSISPESDLTSSLSFERATIVELCRNAPQSIAEIAAQLRIPIGAARVLAGDLVSTKVLDVHLPNASFSTDVELIKRLISGVRAL
jgi:Protein of unknown function (DUF742)